MKLRRIVGALLALTLMMGTMLIPQPASAETLGLNILDPTEYNTAQSQYYSHGGTGTPGTFNATTYPAVNGTDSGFNDHVVRTNDSIDYDFNFNLLGGNGTNVVVTAVLAPAGVAKWLNPGTSACPGGATVSADGNTLTCTFGALNSGVYDLVAAAQALASAPNGQQVQVSATVADGASNVSQNGYVEHDGTPAPQPYDIITSTPKAQLLKDTNAVRPTSTHIFGYNGTATNGYLVTYPILVREGDGTNMGAQYGSAPMPGSFSFTDTMTTPAGTIIDSCGANGVGGTTIAKDPWGLINTGAGHTATNSVSNSGTITCSAGATVAGPVTLTVTGADTTGTTYPTFDTDNSQVENFSYIVSGYLKLFVPDQAVTTVIPDTYAPDGNFVQPPSNGSCVAGDPGLQLCATISLPVYTPSLSGGNSKGLLASINPEAGFPTNNANGPAFTANEEFVSSIVQTNPSNSTSTGLANLTNAVSCDSISTTSKATFWAFDGVDGATSAGQAVIIAASSTASVAAIEYGGAGSHCSDAYSTGANWYSSIDMATAANPNYYTKILNVRVRYEIDAENPPTTPNQVLKFYVNEKTTSTVGPGDLVGDCNSTTANVVYQGNTLPTPFTAGACGQGQVFYSTDQIAKGFKADVSNTALFSVLGRPNPAVDPTQEFVAYLEIDGHLNTVVQNDTFSCDIIDRTKYTVHDFDGFTNPSTPITGPVYFMTGSQPNLFTGGGANPINLNFTSPGVAPEYSTDPAGSPDTCQGGTWSTTEPSPASSITKIRIHWNLQINQNVMMLINLQANAGLQGLGSPTPDSIVNNMSTSTLANPAPPMTTTATADVVTEVASLAKSVSPNPIAIGNPATYTLTPGLYGPSTNSAVITIVDTLPLGLTYRSGSAAYGTTPPNTSTWVPASGSPTPTVTVNGGGQQVLTFTVGTSTAAPGRHVALPTFTFIADTSIALPNGPVVNNAVINDALDTSGSNHAASATFAINGSGGLNVQKTVLPTSSLTVGGHIDWELRYSNQGGSDLPWTDFIDVLPFNGDSLGTHFNGTVTMAAAPTASDAVTFQYTNTPRNQINIDPFCATNGGSHGTSVVAGGAGATCANYPVSTWCNGFGTAGCPATPADVTGFRVLGNVLAHGGSVTHTIDVSTNLTGNLPGDTYWNQYDLRTTNTLVAQAQASASVPIPPAPFLSLVKSCTAPATCTSAPQVPGQDLTYAIVATNTGGHPTSLVTITDLLPNNQPATPLTFYTDYKLGTAAYSFPGGVTMAISYSSDNGVTFTYTPVSAGGGALAGYDRNVTAIRWTMTAGQLSAAGAGSPSGTVSFTAAIR